MLLFLVPFLLSLLFPPPIQCSQTIIVSIVLNGEEKGEFFVYLTDDGDFLVRENDLHAIGIDKPSGVSSVIDDETYLSIASMEGMEYRFDEETLALEINASPDLLTKRIIDLRPQRRPVYFARDDSAFLNYRLEYYAGESFDFQSFTMTNKLGLRKGGILFLTDSSYRKTERDEDFVRLQSSFTYDRRRRMQRIVAGDFFAYSGELGNTVNLGGISLSKIYRMDPYFLKHPMLDISGATELPGDVEVYLDGMRIGTQKISPGKFELQNISYYGGAHVVELVIIDPFGRRRRFRHPFYFTDLLLRRGLHEYSYNAGFIRENFGVDSNNYGKAAFSFFHRYGLTDSLTIGLRGEGTSGRYNFGPQASFLLGKAGIISLHLSGGRNSAGGRGVAASMNYSFQSRAFSARALLRGYNRDYMTVVDRASSERPKYEAGAGLGYSSRESGSISFDFTVSRKYDRESRRTFTLGYTKSVTRNSTIFANFKRTEGEREGNEFFVGMSYYPVKDVTFSARHQEGRDTDATVFQVQKNPPLGEGVGYRTSLERSRTGTGTEYFLNPSIQYNGKHGIYRGEFYGRRLGSETRDSYNLSVAGAVVYVGNTFGLTRPVYDSFALVRVGDLEGVRVKVNNQEVGRTDSRGRLLVPSLGSYYDNRVSIDDRDVPIDYSISNVEHNISLYPWSGSCVNFNVAKLQAFSGVLRVNVDGEMKPLEFYEVKMVVDGREITFPTGKGGEFYIESVGSGSGAGLQAVPVGCASDGQPSWEIRPGTYRAAVEFEGEELTFDITLPGSDEAVVGIGEIAIELPMHREDLPGMAPPPSPGPIESPSDLGASIPEGPLFPPHVALPPIEERMPETVGPLFPERADGKGREPFEIIETVLFPFDSYALTPGMESKLLEVYRRLEKDPDLRVEIEGHCDRIGAASYNLKLGWNRALSVKRYLLDMGLDEKRIAGITSYGERRPLCPGLEESCRRRNRRVVIRLLK